MTEGTTASRECLTEAEIRSFGDAGPATPEAARHVAGCARCQDRLLATDATAPHRPGIPPKAPSLRRLLVLLGLLIFFLAVIALTLSRLR